MSLANFQPTLASQWLSALTLIASQLTLPTQDWTDYSPEKNILIVLSRALETLEIASIERWRGSFLGYAEGDALDTLAEETYQTPRLQETFATTLVDFTNSSGVTRTIDAGAYVTLIVSDDEGASRYRVDGPLSLPAGTTEDIVATAETAGSAGNLAPGDLDEIEANALPGVTVTNTTTATGRDIESDTDLRSRARLAASALSIAGPSKAYEYFARGGERNGETDADIAAIGVNRVKVVEDIATGAVTVYYATPSGTVSGTATTGDLGLINAKQILRVVPSGIDYTGESADPVAIDIDYTVYVPEGLGVDEQQLLDLINARILAYLESPTECPIGGPPEISPTPGKTGAITVSRTRGLITEVTINGIVPVSDAVNTVNLGGEQTFDENEVPVPGTITGAVVFLPPQTP